MLRYLKLTGGSILVSFGCWLEEALNELAGPGAAAFDMNTNEKQKHTGRKELRSKQNGGSDDQSETVGRRRS